MNVIRLETSFGNKTLSLETGKLAKQANSVLAQIGETVVLATAVVGKEPRDCDYLPLKVDYDEKYYASGRIKGSPYIKRETRPPELATLSARFIDRSIRPLFPKSFHNEIQIILSVLSYDNETSPDIVAAIAANAALAISEAPFAGPVGMIRVSKKDGELTINLDHNEVRKRTGKLNIIISSINDKIIMLDGDCNEASEKEVLEAIEFGHKANENIIKLIKELNEKIGKEKIVVEEPEIDKELFDSVYKFALENTEPIFEKQDKMTRDDFIDTKKEEACELFTKDLAEEEVGERKSQVAEYFGKAVKKILVRNVLDAGKRIGGRGIDQIRDLYIEVGLLPRTHGSALFQRGDTQGLGIVTLGGPRSAQSTETMEGENELRYFHHYNFPPFSVGDISTRRFTSNREIGHGALAEKALLPVLPNKEEFPYVIRAVSEILESNGSSSMAATCCSTLALMDAGVPIKKPVSGIAMGLMVDTELKEEDRNYIILTDLSDLEDFGGYMDFKITGTRDGITALQVDMKLAGIPLSVCKETLSKAKPGRFELLDVMQEAIKEPKKISKHAPRILSMKIDPEKIKIVIGKGGETINKIIKETGAEINIEDDGTVSITCLDSEGGEKAITIIKDLTRDIERGEIFEGKIVRLLDFGAIVQLLPGKDGLCHISELANHHVKNINDFCKVGDLLKVKVLEVGRDGKISLSHKKVD